MNSWSPTRLGGLLTGSGTWSVRLKPSAVVIKQSRDRTRRLSLLEVQGVFAKDGIVWAEVAIQLKKHRITLDGIPNEEAQGMVSSILGAIDTALIDALSSASAPLVRWFEKRLSSFPRDRWLSRDMLVDAAS